MTMLEMFSKELAHEAQTTRAMLSRIPDDRFSWQPHEKSMTIQRLATHITDLPNWVSMALTTDGLDFNNTTWAEPVLYNTAELLANLEKSVLNGQAELAAGKEESLSEIWKLGAGDQVYYTANKGEVIRMTLNQIVHHRAQLGVYLRLLDVPIPGSYGPSADEQEFV
jgi:uncharacterized damage-inducible protein DinB